MSASLLGPTILSALDNGTGIDVTSLVSEAISAASAPLDSLQQQQSTISSQTSALDSIQTDLQSLQSAVDSLTGPASQFLAAQATSSDSSILTATAANGASAISHTVVVSNLASTSSYYSAELASGSTPTGTGSFDIQVGSGQAVPITVNSSNNTLSGIAAAINNANAGVTATVINDANGARLGIVSNTSGAPGNITITNDTVGLGFQQSSPGTNANLTVDGVPIASTSNTVSGVIPGVTLNLVGQNKNETVDVTVGSDPTQATTAINNFVSAYNQVIGDLNTQLTVDPSTGEGGPLASDSSIGIIQSTVLQAAAFSSASSNNGIVNLQSLGITLNNDGTLSVNTGTLDSALQTNFSAVQSFFQSAASGFGQNFTSQLGTLTDPTTGVVATDLNGLNQTQQSLTQQISDFQTQLNAEQATLTSQYSAINTELELLPLLRAQVQSQTATLQT